MDALGQSVFIWYNDVQDFDLSLSPFVTQLFRPFVNRDDTTWLTVANLATYGADLLYTSYALSCHSVRVLLILLEFSEPYRRITMKVDFDVREGLIGSS